MKLPQSQGQPVETLGHGDPMNRIGHQAVAQQSHAVMTSLEAKAIKLEPPVFVEQEDALTVVAALGDGVRNALRHHPRLAGQELSDGLTRKSSPDLAGTMGNVSFHSPGIVVGKVLSACIVCVLLSSQPAPAKDKKKVPAAPLPEVIVNAKKIFLSNGGGSNLAYDAFYSNMKEWGRYEVVGSPEEADLIVELAYRVDNGGTRVWSSTNTYNNTTQVHSSQIVDPQLVLTIYDSKTRNPLWSQTDHRRLARRKKNREKETINSAQRIVDDLKARVSIPQ